MKNLTRLKEILVWRLMVRTMHYFVAHHMDQWEQFSFDVPGQGRIFCTISMVDDYPDSFEIVDRWGRLTEENLQRFVNK